MKKYNFFLVFIFLFVSKTLFAQNYDEKLLRADLEQGVVSFVHAVKPAYVEGADITSFEIAVIGKKNLETITKEGKTLLDKTYNLLVRHASDEEIKKEAIKEFAGATKFVLEHIKDGKATPEDDKAYIALFGGDESGLNATLKSENAQGRPCKWYQVGCHLSNVWGWIKGNGSTVKTILEIIKILGELLK